MSLAGHERFPLLYPVSYLHTLTKQLCVVGALESVVEASLCVCGAFFYTPLTSYHTGYTMRQ